MKLSYKSNYDRIKKTMDRDAFNARKEAAKHVRKSLKNEVLSQYGEGDLYKGVSMSNGKSESRVGFKKPAQHAHLIEFGTDERFVKNYRGHGKQVSVGRMTAKPILQPVLEAEAPAVKKILSENWF